MTEKSKARTEVRASNPLPLDERRYTAGDVRRVALRALWLNLREVERMQNETDDHPGIVKNAMTDLGIL